MGEGERALRARDGDHFVFERLAHHLQRLLRKFGKFVEKQHAPVRQRDFAGARKVAAAVGLWG